MKKILTLILCLASVSAWGQNSYISSLEFVGGVGFGKGPKMILAPQYVGQMDFGGFRVGAGVGLRYAKPLREEVTKNGASSREYNNEFDIPVFLRLGFGGEKVYVNVDAGYSLGAIAFYEESMDGGSVADKCYSGLFVDPQIGWRFSQKSALAIGMLLQQGVIGNRVTTQSGDSFSQEFHRKKEFTPALTLRYALSF